MLKKLLKYDLANVYKVLIIFYGLALFFALLTKFFLGIQNSFILNIIGQICSGATIAMIINILINNLMRLWGRFKTNFYGDEAYLTHTLPVEKKTLFLAKSLTGFITLFTSMLVIALTLFIAYYSKDNIEWLKSIFLPLMDLLGNEFLIMIGAFLFIFFLELVNLLQAGYMGMIFGNKMNNMRMGFSVIFGFLIYLGMQVFSLLIIYNIALFNSDIMNLFVTNSIGNFDILQTVLYIALGIYVFHLIVGYVIGRINFSKGVNVL